MKKNFLNLKQNKKIGISVVAIVLTLIFFYCAGVAVSQSADLNKLRNQKESYEAQLEQQKKENEELNAILESDNKDAYMEQKARENGYVKSNEIVFYDISGSN